MKERFKVTPAVFVAVLNSSNEVLLHKRANTGYMDGRFDLPSGHMERGELPHVAAARELEEETSLKANPDDLVLFHIYLNENAPELPYFGLLFKTAVWSGTPVIGEPEKCDEMEFHKLDALPDTTPQVKAALGHISLSGVTYSYFRPNEIGS